MPEDIWSYVGKADALVITTNGIVKANGENVMGGGLALQAAQRFPDLPELLGTEILRHGNHVYAFLRWMSVGDPPVDVAVHIVCFPTKHDYADPSPLSLVAQSLHELVGWTNAFHWSQVVVPRVGAGLGGLDWDTEVAPLVAEILGNDPRFVILA